MNFFQQSNRQRNDRASVDVKFVIFLAVFVVVTVAIASLLQWVQVNRHEGLEIKIRLQEIQEQIKIAELQLEEAKTVSPEEVEQREEETKILSATRVSDDVPVEGVEVVAGETTKTIINHVQRYRIEVPSRLLMARSVSSDWIELHDGEFICLEDPSCEPVFRVVVSNNNPKMLPLEQWFLAEEKRLGGPVYAPREKVQLGGQTVYRVVEEIPRVFEGFYYYWSEGTKIYYLRASVFDDETYRQYIETFRVE